MAIQRDLESVLSALYESEIDCIIVSFAAASWTVRVGQGPEEQEKG